MHFINHNIIHTQSINTVTTVLSIIKSTCKTSPCSLNNILHTPYFGWLEDVWNPAKNYRLYIVFSYTSLVTFNLEYLLTVCFKCFLKFLKNPCQPFNVPQFKFLPVVLLTIRFGLSIFGKSTTKVMLYLAIKDYLLMKDCPPSCVCSFFLLLIWMNYRKAQSFAIVTECMKSSHHLK